MRSWFVGAVATALGIAACTHDGRMPNGCGMPMIDPGFIISIALDLQIRDSYGRGQAIGTTVVIRGPSGSQTQVGSNDTLNIYDASNTSGLYSVIFSRPYYQDLTIDNIVVTGNEQCGTVNTAKVPVVLHLAPGAPPLRSLILLGGQLLDHPGAQAQLIPYFDADPGVSTALKWSVSDTTIATVDANGLVTAKCVKDGGTVKVTATSLFDSTKSGTAAIGVTPATSCT